MIVESRWRGVLRAAVYLVAGVLWGVLFGWRTWGREQ